MNTPSDNISAIEAIEKAMEGVTHPDAPAWISVSQDGNGPNGGFWTCAAATTDSPRYIRADLVHKIQEELALARSVHRWNVDRYGENLAVCRNEHDKGDPCDWETFVPLARAEAAARKAEAMKREIADLREALEMISAESKADNAPIGRSVFKALATCGEIADIAISTRTADRAEQDGSATSSSGRTPTMAKLTTAQKRLLQTAEKHGSALANLSMRSRAGGAVFRAADRLVAEGLLSRPGYALTDTGRAALLANGGDHG